MALVTLISLKKKTFRLQTSQLLGKRRKTYILDVICNRYYFGEVQEEVLGQCSQLPVKKVYLSISGLFQKKKAGWLRKCL